MTTLAILQARVQSSRFPDKILAPFCGQPMILFQLARLTQTSGLDVVVACPDDEDNKPLIRLLAQHGYDCCPWSGPQDDVLGRFYYVAEQYRPDIIIRITADCPLMDSTMLTDMQNAYRLYGAPPDLLGIAAEWGDGFDAEIFTYDALEQAHLQATLASDREHVTPWIWTKKEVYDIQSYPCPLDMSWLRLSVDTPIDLHLIERIARNCLRRFGWHFTWHDIWAVITGHPSWRQNMQARQHNAAYVTQIANERGERPMSWQQLRYGSGK